MPGLCARSAVALLVLIPATAPAFPHEVKAGETVQLITFIYGMKAGEVGMSFGYRRLSSVLGQPSVRVSGCGWVRYDEDDTLSDVARRCHMTTLDVAADGGFAWTMLRPGTVLSLPNIPPACTVEKKPLRELPGMIGVCVPQIIRRPQGVQYLFRWAGDLVLTCVPALGTLLAALTALGWGASRFTRHLPRHHQEWDE